MRSIALFLFVLLLLFAGAFALRVGRPPRQWCKADIRSQASGPGTRWTAITYIRNCGTTEHFQAAVSLLETSSKLNPDDPNVFLIGYAQSESSAVSDSILEHLSARWTSDSTLRVAYDARAEIVYQVVRLFRQVRVDYAADSSVQGSRAAAPEH